jgi:hypothetical protein
VRCGKPLTESAGLAGESTGLSDAAAHGIDLSESAPAQPATSALDDWKFDQEMRQWQARLGRQWRVDAPVGNSGAAMQPASRQPQWHAHAGHAAVPRPHRRRRAAPRRSSPVVLLVLTIGMVTFLTGGGLVACSLVLDRPELWSRGLPLAIAGQVGILLGVALQLERLRHASDRAARQLKQVDAQLEQIGRATDVLSATHVPPAPGFYSHLADQTSPQRMLADLQGQLNLLAGSLGRKT